ncbi:MAG: PorT family protein [Bacteroidia bacterium]|nr:PorT family protein [Bacteroidia bacterium]
MKKLLLIATLFQWSTYSNGQISIGLKTGPSLTKLAFVTDGTYGSTSIKYSPGIGYFFGGEVAFTLSEKFALAAEIQHTSLTSIIKFSEQDLPYSYKEEDLLKLQYLQLPVTLRYTLGTGKLSPYFLFGPTIGYLTSLTVNAEYEETDGVSTYSETYNYSVSGKDWKQYSRVALNATAGFGINKELGPGFLNVELRYNYNFTDLQRAPGSITYRTTNLGIGYKLSF